MLRTGKKIFYILWGVLLIYFLYCYAQNPAIFSVEYLKSFISSYNDQILLVYIILSIVRGFFLIPSTPFVIVGALLFPDRLLLVLLISMIGIMLSATALYYFSDMLGFSEYLEKKYPNKVKKWESKLQSSKATWLVLGWSFFPLVPTDIICYVAGIIKMPYKYMFTGVFVGEIILVSFYIYSGGLLQL
ncbi:putative membrane protein YdjX (TVP38/TMEM64 family) [Tenacibaculum skagerrakense]|uniref:TVP38/TMEM64 family membrane protein n=1 Tax=Tenacibaculum skagerrakense TaxID=186571 RepID=A0A4V2SLT0_9FLAO|nr:VTT domain-containing protein [Tenacibaculum skagerrakense]TCP24596.1 putative membrane protein YdjX (TVP38/TMEM64 family) [Tenacibaculum skagerrakense]